MHKKLIEEASCEQIKEFATDFITMLKARDHDLYEEAEDWLYRSMYGCHFTSWSLKCALENMVNEDGTKGGHWNIEQTNQVAKSFGISFNHINEYDWNYIMNMVYSDYFGAVANELETYAKIAKRFLFDKDAPEGKAYKYYIAMKKH
jgi:hypothetical protein